MTIAGWAENSVCYEIQLFPIIFRISKNIIIINKIYYYNKSGLGKDF
jgi:hypothetical protein